MATQEARAKLVEGLEHALDRLLSKRAKKDFLAKFGPLFLVITFIEDGLRIFLRWSEQMHYMTAIMRRGYVLGVLLLVLSATIQLGSSVCVLRPKARVPRPTPCLTPWLIHSSARVDSISSRAG